MTTNWKTLLVDGFVRDIAQTITKITPPAITGLCLRFFYIESVEELTDRRLAASKAYDLELQFKIEKYILWEMSYGKKWNEHHDKILFYQKTLREVLSHWIAEKTMNVFRETIVDASLRCIQNDNIKMLEIILKHCGYDIQPNNKAIRNNDNYWRNNEIIQFINHSAKYASFDCIKLLLQSPNTINWEFEFQRGPVFLLNAIKYNVDNIELINFIIKKIETIKAEFVYDYVMEEAIGNDLVDIVKTLINNRSHVVTEKDKFYAKSLDGECHKLFVERSNATIMNAMDRLNQEEDVIDLDDDEWDDSHAFDFSEDDDWEKAED